MARGGDEGFRQRRALAHPHDVHGAGRAAQSRVGVCGLKGFELAEIGQNILERPAQRAALRPAVEILGWPRTKIMPLMRVEPPRPFPTRHHDGPVAGALFGLGGEAPVEGIPESSFEKPAGILIQKPSILAAGLQKKDGAARILGETRCEDAAGGAAADDHIIERVHHAAATETGVPLAAMDRASPAMTSLRAREGGALQHPEMVGEASLPLTRSTGWSSQSR